MKQTFWISAFSLLGALTVGCNTLPTSVNASAQVVSGTVTALSADRSSLTVQGQRFALERAPVKVNGHSANSRAISVGQRVRVMVREGRVIGVEINLELKGVLGAIDTTAMTLTVSGVTVKYSAATRFDVGGDADDSAPSGTGVASLTLGAYVEVTGSSDPVTGLIVATKVEVKTPGELDEDGLDDENELKGTVSGLSASNFMIGAVTVNCSAPCALPTGLKNGDFVEAEGVYDAVTKTLTAKKVKLEDNDYDDGDHPAMPGASVILEDNLGRLDGAAKTFKLECYVVDYGSAVVTGTLAPHARVKVVGVVDATNARLVKASAVTVLPSDDDGEHGGGDDHGGK